MTYTCKCGKTFSKNTTAATTGNRMPDYGPEHECFGCPFAYETWVRSYAPGTQDQKVYECRMSQTLQYDSFARMSLGDKCVGKVYSLDFDFLHRVRDYADTLDGIEPDRYAFSSRPSDYSDDGRYTLTIYPTQNNKGVQAKQQLFEKFFNSDGIRKDISTEAEKALILNVIERSKEAAQKMNEPTITAEEFRGTRYSDGRGKIYYVAPCEDGKFRVFFGYDWDRNHDVIPCGNIPKCDTAGIAQQMLDDYANRRGYEAIHNPDEQPESEYSDSQVSDDTDYEDISSMDLEDQFDALMESGDAQDHTDELHEEDDDDLDISVTIDDPSVESPGDDACFPADQSPDIVTGEPISLRDDTFDEIVDACDIKINSALRVMLESHQKKFDFTAKITFEQIGERFVITHETGYKFEPINYKNKSVLGTDFPIVLDSDGNPVIPYDRERQLTFADTVQEEPEPMKTTVDGITGLVETVESAGQLEFGEDAEIPDPTDEQEDYPCDKIDCPFWGLDDTHGGVCCFGDEPDDSPLYWDDLNEAVTEHNCCNDTVIKKYNAIIEGE